MEEEVFDPIVTSAWKRWKSSFSWKWIVGWMVVLASLGIGYWKVTASEWQFVVVSVMSVVVMMGVRLPWLVWEMVLQNQAADRRRNASTEGSVPPSLGFAHNAIYENMPMQKNNDTHCGPDCADRSPKERFPLKEVFHLRAHLLWLLWMVGIVAVKRVGWFAENIDNGTALFLLYLPAVWLFGIKRAINGFLALAIIPFLPFFLGFGMERTAEIWTVVLYFLLVVATVQMVREVREGDDD